MTDAHRHEFFWILVVPRDGVHLMEEKGSKSVRGDLGGAR